MANQNHFERVWAAQRHFWPLLREFVLFHGVSMSAVEERREAYIKFCQAYAPSYLEYLDYDDGILAQVAGAVLIINDVAMQAAVDGMGIEILRLPGGLGRIDMSALPPDKVTIASAKHTAIYHAGLELMLRAAIHRMAKEDVCFHKLRQTNVYCGILIATKVINETRSVEAHTKTRAVDRDLVEWLNQSSISNLNNLVHALFFEYHGKHSYKVSDGLAQKLALTELRGLRGQDIKLPFPSIYVEIPPSVSYVMPNRATGPVELDGAYLWEERARPDTAKDHAAIVPFMELSSDELANLRTLHVLFTGNAKFTQVQSQVYSDDGTCHFAIPLMDNQPVVDTVEQFLRWLLNRSAGGKNRHEDVVSKDEEFRSFAEKWPELLRWLFNVVFYVTSADAERDHIIMNPEAKALWERHTRAPKGSEKRRGLLERYRKLDPQTRTVLGKSILVDRSLPKSIQEAISTGRKLEVRSLVTGHFRRYHIGEGRKETIHKWIAPFWRGPEGGLISTASSHTVGKE